MLILSDYQEYWCSITAISLHLWLMGAELALRLSRDTEARLNGQPLPLSGLASTFICIIMFGAPVKVITDQKALATLYGNPSAKMPLRLERWAMLLLPYQPMIDYRKCCDNPSAYLSRHPQVSGGSFREELVAEEYVNFIAAETVPKAMSYASVLAATMDDPTLSAIKERLFADRWHMLETVYGRDSSVDYEALQSYSRVGTKLTVIVDGLLLKGSQN